MSFVSTKTIIYFSLIMFVMILTNQVFAHPSYMALTKTIPLNFNSGFLHPFSGIDHFLGMLAVGLWASQNQRSAFLVLPIIFPLMMTIGAILGLYIQSFQWIEFSIAISIFILGLCITFAIKLPITASISIISLFALCHGYVHGKVLPHNISLIQYGFGFVVATIALHLIGILIGLFLSKLMFKRFLCLMGIGITAAGVYLITNV